jgi:protein-disulfide isomerase/uncharacterized membrane protein
LNNMDAMESASKRRSMRSAVVVLLLTGLTASGYLVHRTMRLLADANAAGDDVCSIAFGLSCDSTLLSQSFWFLDVPLAGWGVVYYVVLLELWIAGAALRVQFQPQADVASLLIASAGACGSVALVSAIIRLGIAACPFCLLIHGCNLLLAPLIWIASGQSLGGMARRIRSAAGWFWGADDDRSGLGAWRVSAFLNALLVGLLAYQWLYVKVELLRADQVGLTPPQAIAKYEAAPTVDLDVRREDARLGAAGAPAELVVFSSFQCPGCRQFAKHVHELRERFGEQLTIVFKHYPLSSECNSRLRSERHPLACPMARASVAAQRQGRFWEFHDQLFALPHNADASAIDQIAENLELDPARFEMDRRSPQTAAQLQLDVALGTELGISGTPEVFLNGKPVPSRKRALLESLVEHVIERHN